MAAVCVSVGCLQQSGQCVVVISNFWGKPALCEEAAVCRTGSGAVLPQVIHVQCLIGFHSMICTVTVYTLKSSDLCSKSHWHLLVGISQYYTADHIVNCFIPMWDYI